MAINASLTITGALTGLPEGSTDFSFTLLNAASPGLRDVLTITAAMTTALQAVTIPSGCLYVLIVPPASNDKTIEVAGADVAGATLHPTNPTLLSLPASAAALYIGVSATVASNTNIQLYFL